MVTGQGVMAKGKKFPNTLSEFVGQENVVKQLAVSILASHKSGHILPHILFTGPAGLGKTTLAECIARTIEAPIKYATGGTIRNLNDVNELIDWVNLRVGGILFIDEIHALPSKIEEIFFPIMQDFNFEGDSVNEFTLLGGTTNAGDLSKPLRDRFVYTFQLDHYSEEAIKIILAKNWQITPEAAHKLAIRSHGIPRIAKNYLQMCRDQAIIEDRHRVELSDVTSVMDRLEIDEEGLGPLEREILLILFEAPKAVGLEVIALALDTEPVNLKQIHERILLQKGYLVRVRSGRTITKRGLRYLIEKDLVDFETGCRK